MNRQDARKLLQKYRLGQCTPEEKSWIEQWYSDIAKQEFSDEHDIVKQQIISWKAIQNNISRKSKQSSLLFTRPFLVAASIALLLGLSFLMYHNRDIIKTPESERLHYSLIETKNSELKNFVLPDGSKVWLNAGSKLKYSNQFDKKLREVTLEDGEAYFDIKHDTEKPFVVYAGITKTQVLGTAFAIRSYKSLAATQITVTRGKVGVMKSGDDKNKPVFLIANQQVILNPDDGSFQKTKVSGSDFISWREGKLKINNESLSDIAVILEKRFNIPIHFKGQDLGRLRFSAAFEASEKLDDILEVLCLAENLAYVKNGKVITLSQRK
ncbi:FecR family protein [Dyadobacter koreensis]|uniref:FecR family protein n=1 Tax=Dyadobacter koreensis TaxID=408657 RepID=A0A1H6VNE4_9BACT|nr:FecR domain-containing protein [Dyadobacter koreensis]SEJ02190.1 FecR family protein [Dyadobacter koreensis]